MKWVVKVVQTVNLSTFQEFVMQLVSHLVILLLEFILLGFTPYKAEKPLQGWKATTILYNVVYFTSISWSYKKKKYKNIKGHIIQNLLCIAANILNKHLLYWNIWVFLCYCHFWYSLTVTLYWMNIRRIEQSRSLDGCSCK